ncbi:MAG: hypothetical protein IPJ85_16890 [Flavobacteriales bacterium]|nr:hypothetical protein [Flavobacteriales bacterium]
MTSAPLRLDATERSLDLTFASTSTWGVDARRAMANGRMALWSGDVNRDGVLRYVGNSNDRDPILVAIGGINPVATVSGYRLEDVNLSGTVMYGRRQRSRPNPPECGGECAHANPHPAVALSLGTVDTEVANR